METGELFLGSDFRRPAADFFSGLRAQLQADNFSGFCELSDNVYFPCHIAGPPNPPSLFPREKTLSNRT